MAFTDSWWIKLGRARLHLEDIESRVQEVVGPNPQQGRVTVEHTPKGWRYRLSLSITEDEWLPVIIGDFLFNVRSALDHLAVAHVPSRRKRDAQFPIFTDNLWEQSSEESLGRERERSREKWSRYTCGMAPKVLEVVTLAQPYQAIHKGESPDNHALAILSAFQNADKHRELTIVAHGLHNPTGSATFPDGTVETFPALSHDQMLTDGAVIVTTDVEAKVQVSGTAKVAMARGRGRRLPHRELPSSLTGILQEASAVALRIEAAVRG